MRRGAKKTDSEFVPSSTASPSSSTTSLCEEEEDEEVAVEAETTASKPKSEKARKATPSKRPAKKRAVEEVSSPRKQLSARKRTTSRLSPLTDSPSKGQRQGQKAKKQKLTPPKEPKLSEEAKKAVQRVDAEILKLPAERDLKFSKMDPSMKLFGTRVSEIPEKHGAKTVPEGHPECLHDKTFVISGVLESLTREEAANAIKRHGGRVTTSVSGKTTFLLVGMDAGGAKCEKELWVDKYRPKSLSEMIGNPTNIKLLREWLAEWHERFSDETESTSEPMSGTRQTEEETKKALLFAGQPGVGKTTAAHLAAAELGFSVVEVNASDTRNKADRIGKGGIAGKMSNRIKALCQNRTLPLDEFSGFQQTVLIMDEVDGMSAGDRGGVADLIQNIKTSKIPIICICNDKYSRKLMSLKNHCTLMDFRRPTKQQIAKYANEICVKEGLSFSNSSVLETLVEQAHGDVRTVIGGLQFIRAQTTTVSYQDVEDGRVSVHKNHDVSPFETSRTLLTSGSSFKSWKQRSDMVFGDTDLIPLLVQENYINYVPAGSVNERGRMRLLAKAASLISFGERIQSAIYSQQKWSLMPCAVDMGTLAPAATMKGRREAFNPHEMNFTRFTSFLPNLSTTNKQLRLLKIATTRMTSQSEHTVDKEALALDYFPVLRCLLTKPLIDGQSEAIPEVLQLMKDYCIDKDNYNFIMDVTQFKSRNAWAKNPLPSIPAKVKSALTRQANATNLSCPGLPAEAGAITKAGAKEEPTDTTTTHNPESGIIEDVIQEEEVKKEEDEDGDDEENMLAQMKQSGYKLNASSDLSTRRDRITTTKTLQSWTTGASKSSTRGRGRHRGRGGRRGGRK